MKILVSVLMSLYAGACDHTSQNAAPEPRVVIVGDSIAVDVKPYFEGSIDGVKVDAIWGRGIDSNAGGQQFPTLRQAVAAAIPTIAPGGWLVIQDDGGEGPTEPEFVQYVTNLLPDTVGLAWVSPSNNDRWYTPYSQQTILNLIGAQPVHAYIDWHSAATSDMLTDGLHPNEQGKQALNHLVWSVTG